MKGPIMIYVIIIIVSREGCSFAKIRLYFSCQFLSSSSSAADEHV